MPASRKTPQRAEFRKHSHPYAKAKRKALKEARQQTIDYLPYAFLPPPKKMQKRRRNGKIQPRQDWRTRQKDLEIMRQPLESFEARAARMAAPCPYKRAKKRSILDNMGRVREKMEADLAARSK